MATNEWDKKASPLRILVVGWNSTHVRAYLQHLIDAGHIVFWVGHGAFRMNEQIYGVLNIEYVPGAATSYNGPMGQVPAGNRCFKFDSLMDMLGGWKMDFDLLLHFQDWTHFTDLHRLPFPYIFFLTEPFYPVVSRIVDHVVTPGYELQRYVDWKYKKRFSTSVIPWALRNELVGISPYLFERTIPCSFAGKVHNYQFYKNRQEILPKIVEAIPGFVGHWTKERSNEEVFQKTDFKIEMGKGRLDGPEYTDLLLKSKFGINFPTFWGPNFRDYEVPGLGALLLTQKTRDHELAGFEHGKNCYFFTTAEDAIDLIKNCYDEEVARAGFLHIHKNNLYCDRFAELDDLVEGLV